MTPSPSPETGQSDESASLGTRLASVILHYLTLAYRTLPKSEVRYVTMTHASNSQYLSIP